MLGADICKINLMQSIMYLKFSMKSMSADQVYNYMISILFSRGHIQLLATKKILVPKITKVISLNRNNNNNN